MKKSILLGLNLIITVVFYSQNKNISFSNYYNLSKDFPSLKHSSIQPFLESHLIISDTVEKSNRSKIGKKIFSESLLNVVENDVHLTADPLFNFTIGPKHPSENFR